LDGPISGRGSPAIESHPHRNKYSADSAFSASRARRVGQRRALETLEKSAV